MDTAAPAPAEQPSPAPAAVADTLPAPFSSWKVSGGPSEQEKTVSSMSASGRLRLLVREAHGKVECLFSSADTPDTFADGEKRRATVTYHLDDGSPASDEWIVSRHATALRYPGDGRELAEKIVRARRMAIEFHTGAGTYDIDSFDVALFPRGIIEGLEPPR